MTMKQAEKKFTAPRKKRAAAELTLTPRTFRRLDLIARQCGYVVRVVSVEEMGENCWGRVNPMSDSLYQDLTVPHLRGVEIQSIQIASRIPVDAFHQAQRPEIDLRGISRSKIWDYVIWHEIGHLRGNFDLLGPQFDRDLNDPLIKREWVHAHRVIIEVLADRYAWAAIGEGRPLPVNPRRPIAEAFISEWIAKLDARYGRKPDKDRLLPTEPFKYVPTSHMKAGIPFENPEDREASLNEFISYRRTVLPTLLDKARQAGVIVEYLHGNEGEVPTPELGWHAEMSDRVRTMHSLQSELRLLGGYAKVAVAESLPDAERVMNGAQ